MTKLNDARFVREEYRTETGLAGRAAIYRFLEPGAVDVREMALHAVAAARPRRVLEVGCGWGAFAERLGRELSADVVAVDLSERMVDLARRRGVDALVGDVQRLPFRNQEFDGAAALWMLYHVPDLGRGLAELARVLRPGARLVAITNGAMHLQELYRLLGRDRRRHEVTFGRENGSEALRRHFARVERHDIDDWLIFPDRAPVVEYAESSLTLRHLAANVPLHLPVPFRVRRSVSMFVAETAGPPLDSAGC